MPKPKQKATKAKPRFSKWKRIGVAGLAGLSLGVLSFPIWSVWLAKPLASMAGVEIGKVQSLSWDRWQVDQVSLSRTGIEFEAEQIQMPSPSELALEYLNASPGSQSLVLSDWSVNIAQSDESQPSADSSLSVESIIAQAKAGLNQLADLLHGIKSRNGRISIDGKDTINIQSFELEQTELRGALTYLPQSLPLTIEGTLEEDWTLQAEAPSLALSSDLKLSSNTTETRLSGTLSSSRNPISIEAFWPAGRNSLLPENLQLNADGFVFDNRYAFWNDAPELEIDSIVNWENNSFEFEITGNELGHTPDTPQIRIAGGGNKDAFLVQSINVDLPWLTLENDHPVRIDPTFETPPSDTQLTARVVLDELPFVEASGQVNAFIKTSSTTDNRPIVNGEFSGESITLFDTTIKAISANIDLQADQLEISQVELHSQHGSTLSAESRIDLSKREITSGKASVDLRNESELLSQLAPGLSWSSISGDISVEGKLDDPKLEANLESQDLSLPSTTPFDLEIDLAGTLSSLELNASAQNETDTLSLAFSSSETTTERTLTLNQLSLTGTEQISLLALDTPASISIQKSDSSISLPQLSLSGTEGTKLTIDNLAYSSTGLSLKNEISNLNPNILQSWLLPQLPEVSLDFVRSEFDFRENHSQIKAIGEFAWSIDPENRVNLAWNVSTPPDNQKTLSIDKLDVRSDDQSIITAKGQFPISLAWKDGFIDTELNPQGPLDFSLKSAPSPKFWSSISELLPIEIESPSIDATLAGTLQAPEGDLDLSIPSLQLKASEENSLSVQVTDLQAKLFANSSNLVVENLRTHIGQNTISASARFPLPETNLPTLLTDPSQIDLDTISAKANLQLIDLESLSSVLPDLLREDGQVEVELVVEKSDIFARGKLKDLATRPLPPLGALSEISGDFTFEKGVWSTEGIQGVAEKSPFFLKGKADLNEMRQPRFDLAFQSTEFPLLRDNGIMVTSDVDLQLVSNEHGQSLIKGDLLLRKGLLLIEPELLAGSTKTVGNRPPYFAVEIAPFNQWGLDIDIRGDNFLRVSNSFFEGTLSAEFDLEGNLGSPLLIGAAETEEGRIFFPASSLKLTQGRAFVTRDRPTELQLEATAEGRLFAYDFNMDVSGVSDAPELVVTSNPALTQVEALLLLTTGAQISEGDNIAQQSATSLGIFIGKGLFKRLTGGNSDTASKLNIEVGQDISLQGKKTIGTSYEISDTLEVEGEYDKYDEFNANLKWTFYKR
ncbi:translocation/assembly module TamB domain-containing protein [Pelagicoccus mobilis]|uniref:Translocation/assembly module TamB domain-containing protein n=1 Tax=Pelagicoccus mobilis TaxID=415221 RepID=A0A934S0R1_9BACT|nr:translocation/assembly module TamB domain-containing protein [Pelagicoccus mobilis]MBK1877752.1 translocation/assembly module TamB domain-containing protein [Pelagicoccus mobilis]